MEARFLRLGAFYLVVVCGGAGYQTPNFVVEAPTAAQAERIGRMAERYRHTLAVEWLGKSMPDWSAPCPITAHVAPHLGAGGATSFLFDRGHVYGWKMEIQGSEERILDSVLPHEVTHTIFATHFRRPLPRWADEGACTMVEHDSERKKQQDLLIRFLRTNKGIAFSQMFAMKEYPPDVLPLYAQGYSLARYLIGQGGKHKFIAFVGDGLKRENWTAATKSHYGFESLSRLQDSWLEWVKQGSPALDSSAPQLALNRSNGGAANVATPASYRLQSEDAPSRDRAAGNSKRESAPRQLDVSAASLAQSSARLAPLKQPNAHFAPVSADQRAVPREPQSAFDRSSLLSHPPKRVDQRGDAQKHPTANAAPSHPRAKTRSVYERGIEPSRDPERWPVSQAHRDSAVQEVSSASSRHEILLAEASSRPAADDFRRDPARRVLLEWRDPNAPADVAW